MSGTLAGISYASVGILVGGPYLEQAVEIENQIMFEAGEVEDTPEFRTEYNEYREWQRNGHLLAGIIYGISMGSLFGIVFALSRKYLPGRSHLTRSMFLAGIMCFSVYLLPAVKYPPNPPAAGDPETILLRTVLHLLLIAIIGLGAVGFFKLSRIIKPRSTRLTRACACIFGYAAFAAAVFVVMPASPDPPPLIQASLLDTFRASSMIGAGVFWTVAGAILGILWPRLVRDRVESTQSLNSDSTY